MKCISRRRAKQLWQPMISLSPVTKPNSQKPANGWRRIKKCCLPFTTSRLNIGRIYGPPTPSNPPLLLSDYELTEQRGCGSRIATLTMVFKLGLEAQKHWRRLQGFELIPKVVTGVRFVDGEEQTQQAA